MPTNSNYMSKKYIYACVRIPIELSENGHHITYNDHAKVEFEKCDELPPKSNLGKYNYKDIFEKMHVKEIEEPIMVLQADIKTDKLPMKNSTFKNREVSSKYSQKNRVSTQHFL